MSAVKFELDNLFLKDSDMSMFQPTEFTLTCLTELSGDSSQWELQLIILSLLVS